MNESTDGNGGTADPVEVKRLLGQLIGQTYGELHKLDQHIIGPSAQLRHRSNDFKVTAQNVLNDAAKLVNLQQHAPQPMVQIQPQTEQVQPQHVQPQVVIAQVAPAKDDNQLEFNFDNSATAQKIFDILCEIKTRLIALEKAVLDQHGSEKKIKPKAN